MLRSHLLRQVSPSGPELIGVTGGNSSPDIDFSNTSYGPFNMPSGVAVGDFYVVVFGVNRGQNNLDPIIGGQSPANAIYDSGDSPTNNNPGFTLFFGTLTASQVTNGTVVMQKTGQTPQDPSMAVAFFRGISGYPTQTVTHSTTSTPPVVPVNCDAAIVALVDENASGGGYTAPSGYTKAIEQGSTNGSNHSVIFYKFDTISSGTSVGALPSLSLSQSCLVTFGATI